tara:strand:- start:612 stop:833 length:222 start_codon:yes stop_codon:yes gene_type:complete
MKIFIEDYNGNDLCSFEVPALEVLYDIYEKDTMWLQRHLSSKSMWNCSLADIDTDENGNEYIRIQLEVRPFEI